MATFQTQDRVTGEDVILRYEVHGEGFPILLIAPGGMKSAVPVWANAPYNPIDAWRGEFQVIAMDQRNAGGSTGPIHAEHGWQTYAEDQLALLDHLNVDRFIVSGMCIGGPYGFGLMRAVPERVSAAVLFQPIGLTDNRQAFYDMFDGWMNELKPTRGEVSEADWQGMRANMYGGDNFLFNVGDAEVSATTTPMLVLMGRDLYHPEASSRRVAELAPNARLIEAWKDGEDIAAARAQTLEFLRSHAA